MQIWKKLLITAALATIILLAGTIAYFNYFAKRRLIISTTTSLYDTGLWDYLEARFEELHGMDLQVIAKGSGMALQLGKRGDVDVVTVHDPDEEAEFVAQGYAVELEVDGHSLARVPWAYNYFVIVGPKADPAGIRQGNLSAEEAFRRIQLKGKADPESVKFISRGDSSGTHAKEKAVWESAGYDYSEDIQKVGAADGWYVEAGTGMGATLRMADEMMAYTLSDRGTFLAYRGELDLTILLEGADVLLNVYTAIVCKNGRSPRMAQNLVSFLRREDTQALIAGFGVAEYGEPLFYRYDAAICG